MVGTYASALIVLATAALAGQAILAIAGQQRASPLAPAVGIGPILAIAWGTVQLPGEGTAALIAVLAVAAVSAIFLAGRVEGAGAATREALPAAAIALAAASIPFAVEGRFGVLGTGFNVDMSQHLFAADWLADPTGLVPGLVDQGYPLGPHSLAVAVSQVDGNIVHGFDGLTIAVPVIAAAASLVVLRDHPPLRRAAAGALVALPYLVASYLAQGQFKELIMGLLVLGFGLALHQLARENARRPLAAVPLAAIAIGALYTYSAPGLAWLAGTAILYGLAELYRRRGEGLGAVVRSVAVPVAIGIAVVLVAAAPELGRIAEFRTNATNVAGGSAERPSTGDRGGGGQADSGGGGRGEREQHDNDLGNLFDQISPAEVFGVWPSGDFRVDPGGGGVPAGVFWLGVALGAVAFLLALARWLRRGEPAVPAALLAAAAIYAAALAFATPYTAAKALMMAAPLVMVITVRELAAPDALTLAPRSPRAAAIAAIAAALCVGAAASSLLALGKAPVGPTEYSPGLAEMRPTFRGEPTLVLADPTALETEHARDFLDWEARGGDPVCIEPTQSQPGGEAPDGIRYVVTTQGESEPPFAGLREVESRGPYALWERSGSLGGPPPEGAAGDPSECGLERG